MHNQKELGTPETPIYNCHTHIFTDDYVPPYLGKKIFAWPFYYFITTKGLILINRLFFKPTQIKWIDKLDKAIIQPVKQKKDSFLFKFIVYNIKLILILFYLFKFYEYLTNQSVLSSFNITKKINEIIINHNLLFFIFCFIFLKPIRSVVLFIIKNILSLFLGNESFELIKKYSSLANYADISNQKSIFKILRRQYDEKTKFIVLTMDMEYMGAGQPAKTYNDQLNEILEIKRIRNIGDRIFPFIFVDPRRIRATENSKEPYKDKVIKLLKEKDGFSGVKIYPALGYFPFEKELLEIWLFCAEHNIPIMTHCIKGVIYDRGDMQKIYKNHPIFKINSNKTSIKIPFKDDRNVNLQRHFTHPLNFLVLLDIRFLKELLLLYNDQNLNEKFEFDPDSNEYPKKNLSNLKICFGHYGGDEEWVKHIDSDMNEYENKLHIDFKQYSLKTFEENMGHLWFDISWYSIINHLMYSYSNVYTDISFTVSNPKIFGLLKHSLRDSKINEKILFGTDFFLVRQKKTEKQIWTELSAFLSKEEMLLIANENPKKFLETSIIF